MQNARQAVREHARTIAERTQQLAERTAQLEDAVVGGLIAPRSVRELEQSLEAEAQRLWRPAQAAELLERWLHEMRSQDRMPSEAPSPGPGEDPLSTMTFKQVFLRSRALECTLDAVARSPKLRAAVREHALPPPEVPVADKAFPAVFASLFIELLRVAVGPQDLWVGLLGALMSSERVPTANDDTCHRWLVQLIAGLRMGWEDAADEAREAEVGGAWAVARENATKLTPFPEKQVAPGNLAMLMAHLVRLGEANSDAHRARELQSALAAQRAEGTLKREERARARLASAAATAAMAAEHADQLAANRSHAKRMAEEERDDLGKQAEALRAKIEVLSPMSEQLQREIEEVEVTHSQLQQHLKMISEQLDGLRVKRTGLLKQEQGLLGDLKRIETAFAEKLAAEDEAYKATEARRALAEAVVDLARDLASKRPEDLLPPAPSDVAVPTDADDDSLSLAEREATRLRLVSCAADMCSSLAEEDPAQMQVEIMAAVDGVLAEASRCRSSINSLCRDLSEFGNEAASSSSTGPSLTARAGQLVATLKDAITACDASCDRLCHVTHQAAQLLAEHLEAPTPLTLGEAVVRGWPGAVAAVVERDTTIDSSGSADPPGASAGQPTGASDAAPQPQFRGPSRPGPTFA